jgi:DNA-binding MarR family transcriptional regulator
MPGIASPTSATHATTANLGFLLAKAAARWNELLAAAFAERGFDKVRPAYGSVLLPLFEEDGLRMGELAERARLSKQTLTSMIGQMERDGLVTRERDPQDGRAWRVQLTPRARALKTVAEEVLGDLDARVAEHLSRSTTETTRQALRDLMNL